MEIDEDQCASNQHTLSFTPVRISRVLVGKPLRVIQHACRSCKMPLNESETSCAFAKQFYEHSSNSRDIHIHTFVRVFSSHIFANRSIYDRTDDRRGSTKSLKKKKERKKAASFKIPQTRNTRVSKRNVSGVT